MFELEEIKRFLLEDVGTGDLTALIVPADRVATASVLAREDAVLCGRDAFDAVFRCLDPLVEIDWACAEGADISAGEVICRLKGAARALLTGERTALNLLQTLSGCARQARAFARASAGTKLKVLDTRKTLPGLRRAQKYAVRIGGCANHRLGLDDGILIKENHIAAAGSIRAAYEAATSLNAGVPIEIEVETLEQLDEAIAAGARRLLLDNFSLEMMREAVKRSAGRAELEVSGNVSVASIADIAATGVDYVSVGAITKNLQALDLSMRVCLDRSV